jgi:hypothetical protein
VGILTGPPFFAEIAAYMNGTGKLAIQGVDYPAEISGFLAGGSTIGATTMYSPPLFNLFTHCTTNLPPTDISKGGTCKLHARQLPQHAPNPQRLFPRRRARPSRDVSAPGEHHLQNLLRRALWGPQEWHCSQWR